MKSIQSSSLSKSSGSPGFAKSMRSKTERRSNFVIMTNGKFQSQNTFKTNNNNNNNSCCESSNSIVTDSEIESSSSDEQF